MNLPEKVKEVIKCEGLIPSGASVLVGVSGGADSVALLHVLDQIGYKVTAAHLNHSLRGAVADEDEQFVRELCAELDVPFVSVKKDVTALAREQGLSLEMAARGARHRFFMAEVDRMSVNTVIALAHHADDQLETFFLRAARGTGSSGLGGMKPIQQIASMKIIRPFLELRRDEILNWLKEKKISWREDASNADVKIPRNLVRHRIIQNLEQINERAADNILRTMRILRDEESCPERAQRRREACDWLISHHIMPSFDTVERFVEFANRTDGSRTMDFEGQRVINEYGVLRLETGPTSSFLTVTMEQGYGIRRGLWEASISLRRVAERDVIVREPRPGDRICPYGMDGSKKLQDVFTDLKVAKAKRVDWPVVECGGEIVWVPGYRIAQGWELAVETDPALHLFCMMK